MYSEQPNVNEYYKKNNRKINMMISERIYCFKCVGITLQRTTNPLNPCTPIVRRVHKLPSHTLTHISWGRMGKRICWCAFYDIYCSYEYKHIQITITTNNHAHAIQCKNIFADVHNQWFDLFCSLSVSIISMHVVKCVFFPDLTKKTKQQLFNWKQSGFEKFLQLQSYSISKTFHSPLVFLFCFTSRFISWASEKCLKCSIQNNRKKRTKIWARNKTP